MNSFRKGILKMEQVLLQAIYWALFMMMAAMTVSVLLGVLFRYVLKSPLPWSEELARYLMIWGACLGAAVAYRQGSHFAITLVIDKLHGALRRVVVILAQLMVLAFIGIVAVEGILLLSGLEGQTSPAMQIPMSIPYMSIPAACLIIIFEALVLLCFSNPHPASE